MEMEQMDGDVGRLFGGFRTGDADAVGYLAVVPLIAPGRGKIDVVTLDDAVASHGFKVTEASRGGNVNELLCSNPSERTVLIVQGELLTGGKQDRMVSFDILLGPGMCAKVPVNCVESGRWHHESEHLSPSREMAPESFRHKGVTAKGGALSSRAAANNQREVWGEISDTLHRRCGRTETSSIHNLFLAKADHELRDAAAAYRPVPDQVGHVIVERGEPVKAELFGDPDLYAHYCQALLRAALRRRHRAEWGPQMAFGPDTETAVGRFLTRALSASAERTPGISLGWELRFSQADVSGFALEHGDRIIHAAYTGRN